MRTSKSSTTRVLRRRVTRYSLPEFLNCRLTTSQRQTDILPRLAISHFHPSSPLFFRYRSFTRFNPFLFLSWYTLDALSQTSKPLGANKLVSRGALIYWMLSTFLPFFLCIRTNKVSQTRTSLPIHSSLMCFSYRSSRTVEPGSNTRTD